MTQQIIDQIAVVSVDIGFFGAYRRATEDDIKKLGGKLPDSKVLTKGSKRIFPNYDDLLREHQKAQGVAEPDTFGGLKKEIERFLWKRGTRLVGKGAWAVPMGEAEEVIQKLKECSQTNDRLKSLLEMNYDQWLEDHIAANPKEEAIIRAAALDKDDAVSKFRFRWDVYKIVPLGAEGESDIESMASSLTGQLFTEVAVAAKQALDKSFSYEDKQGNRVLKDKVGQKAMHQIHACRDKLDHLHFLDPSVEGAVKLLDNVLTNLPKAGYIEDTPSNDAFTRLHRLVSRMADAGRLAEAGKRVAEGEKPEDVMKPTVSIEQILDKTGDLLVPPQAVIEELQAEQQTSNEVEETSGAEETPYQMETLFF